MKGTFFSADFVVDESNNARLLEVNTDTQLYSNYQYDLDFQPLIDVLTANSSSITEFHMIYKDRLHGTFALLLSESVFSTPLSESISFHRHIAADNSIYPPTVTDSGSRFILRCAYSENAIFDSTYAKGNFNTVQLMHDYNATSSVVEMYHSSSNGLYDTLLSTNITTASNIPHLVSKNLNEGASNPVQFYTIGSSSLSDAQRLQGAVESLDTDNNYIQKFYISPDAEASQSVQSLRTYNITYGSNLDLITLSSGFSSGQFNLPTSAENVDTNPTTLQDKKHFYEFTTKMFDNGRDHGVLREEQIQLNDLTYISASNITTASVVRSYHVDGLPDTDSDVVLSAWSISGSSLPATTSSYYTSASVENITVKNPHTQHIVQILDVDGNMHDYGGANRLMVYASASDEIKFLPAEHLGKDHSLVLISGSNLQISESYYAILDNADEELISIDVEGDDLYFTKTGPSPKLVVTHNTKGGFTPTGVFFSHPVNCTLTQQVIDGDEDNQPMSHRATAQFTGTYPTNGSVRCIAQNPSEFNSISYTAISTQQATFSYDVNAVENQNMCYARIYNGSVVCYTRTYEVYASVE